MSLQIQGYEAPDVQSMPRETQNSSQPPPALRIEALTFERMGQVCTLSNEFVGNCQAPKVMCCWLPLKLCPTSSLAFSLPYRRNEELLSLTCVAIMDNEAVGFVQMEVPGLPRDGSSVCLHRRLEPGECYISQAAVTAKVRGKGVGTAMLRWCEEVARARGCTFLSLGVVNGNPAERLYERFGFVSQHETSCQRAASTALICCFFGMPHLRCGGKIMRKNIA